MTFYEETYLGQKKIFGMLNSSGQSPFPLLNEYLMTP